MIIRKLTAFLLALCVATLITALCLSDWHCGNLFGHCTEEGIEDRDAMLTVVTMLVIGLIFIFIVFLLDVVLLFKKSVHTGLITARFTFIYLGAALAFIAVIVYTAVKSNMWGYFLAVFASTISIVLAMMAVVSSRCVSRSEVVTVQHN
ncbi:hypothetical protein ECG_07406 [Echinococcus granulosus]|uniref:Neutral sphingomyelinase n=1 Tax=Echinococcus granulosus TaxID=6210 RepID=W6UE75_ECHGR|nr:hypothetical protein EGR_05846 [Echinococcus granulosus]XP_024350559.1 hypothetical protein EGR_05847 [Echinococcus granulosus]EUB59362.1 hypothetical protein EGR_05846 [Echinococcus granulosus]EUB59363.1 hypothetical protein EGR_05847 [Echinococcus granulosus]KAH9281044.1 hypothetical protein ECG_07406 [Echinococcus granulosus]